MMKNLPNEVNIDILKYLKVEQLFSVQQTNKYFYVLIDDHKFVLARMNFYTIYFHVPSKRELTSNQNNQEKHYFPLINKWKSLTKLPSFELKKKVDKLIKMNFYYFQWHTAIKQHMPVLLRTCKYTKFTICVSKNIGEIYRRYYFRIPNIPGNIEHMLVIRQWLEILFNCTYEIVFFYELINPELIKLLFEDNKRIPFQFNIKQRCAIFCKNCSCESLLDFSLNHLKIGECLQLDFNGVWNIEENTENLFNLLINERAKFKEICYTRLEESTLYDMIIKLHVGPRTSHFLFGQPKPEELYKPKPELYDFELSEQLEKKWKDAIKKSIPMYITIINNDITGNVVLCSEKG
uniref:F-box domain-containing protein n=1 Tax=Meloidogyne hapla TaxID=6305 RepID=A0A1I8BCZ3_MELHA